MTPIEIARNFVQSRVQQPALESKLSEKIKNKVRHSNAWLNRFRRVGDLLVYLKRFHVSKDDPVYREIKSCGLLAFEDIIGDFEKKFSQWSQDCTRASDFILGSEYSVHDILIFVRNYDTRAGGMFVLEADEKPSAVVIKATLKDGRYPNAWIEEPTRLKYYLKSIDGDFGEHFKPNASILNTPGISILTFVRTIDTDPFVFRGIFNYRGIYREADGPKWFDLQLASQQPSEVVAEAEYVAKTFDDATKMSASTLREDRLARLKNAQKKPLLIKILSTAFIRNPDVVAEVLYRAEGVCQECKNSAPFMKKADGLPYLEVHHRVPLAKGGDDTVENGIALCPNCHRKFHFG